MVKNELELADSVILMLAYLCIKDVEGLGARVEVLDRFDLGNKNIATICSVADQSVRNARAKYKKVKKGGK